MQDITFRTISGRYVSLLNPDPDTIDIRDIAHSLAGQNRFIGHLPQPYSVGQHSLFVEEIIEDPALKLAGLMHDAPEWVTGDMTWPVKQLLRRAGSHEFDRLSERLWTAICIRFGIDPDALALVKPYDLIARATEDRDFRGLEPKDVQPHHRNLFPMPAAVVEGLFLERFYKLTQKPQHAAAG